MRVLDTLKHLVGQHPNKARKGLHKATSFVDEQTGGKYRDKLGKARQKAEDFIDDSSSHGNAEPDPEQAGPEQPGPGERDQRQ